jgi:hypothetical protein
VADQEGPTGEAARQPGWREVGLIAIAIVVIVLAISVVTDLIPDLGNAVRQLPILILVLIGGTAFVVWRILRAPTARP